MKTFIRSLVCILIVALIAIPVSAFSLPADGDTYTIDAKTAFPSDFQNIYGIKFDVTLDATSKMDGVGDLFWAEFFLDSGSEAATATQNYANTVAIGLLAAGGFTLDPVEQVEIVAGGDPVTITYSSTTPLFAAGAAVAKVRINLFASAKGVGVKFAVNNVKWLASNGSEYTGTQSESPSTGDPSVLYYVLVLALGAVAVGFTFRRVRA